MELHDQAQKHQQTEAVKLFKLFCVGSLASRIGMGAGDIERAKQHLGVTVQFGEAGEKNITQYLKNTVCLS